MKAAIMTRRFWLDYTRALMFNEQMAARVEALWEEQGVPTRLLGHGREANRNTGKVGYVVATASPVTRAHIALARTAADDMKLDRVVFLLWPFHYIPGFHAAPLDAWVAEQRHLPWEERYALLDTAIRETGDPRLAVLQRSKAWYIESESIYDAVEPLSAFWTGTWYVLRKLQWALTRDRDRRFCFVCGVDQFNPNVETLLFSEGTEQVWRDYSVAQHLAIHDVYAVPRDMLDSEKDIEEFSEPFGCDHAVVIGRRLEESRFAASRVRFGKLEPGMKLEDYVHPGVAAAIRTRGWWGHAPSGARKKRPVRV